jgi:phenylacetate-CoA ligase
MFVHPEQLAEIARRNPEVSRLRLVVDNPDAQDRMVLHCEAADVTGALRDKLVEALREQTKLRGTVELLAPGALPNDGKVIEDKRVY